MAKLSKKEQKELRDRLTQESYRMTGMIAALEQEDSSWAAFATSDQRSRDALEADPAARERDVLAALTASAAAGSDEVRRALEKFSAGTYGVCDSCGQDIAADRLRARPRSVLCVRCA